MSSQLLNETPQLYFNRIGLTHSGQELVVAALSAEPEKRLKSNSFKRVIRYSSIKNGHTVQIANQKILTAVLEIYESVPGVLRYLDYALELHLDYKHSK